MNKTRIASSFLLLVFVSTPPAYGHAVVDCDAGDNIQAALDAGETEVEFTGTCSEFVTIANDNTVIRGGSGNPRFDRITEGLSVEGADGVVIRDAGIQGSHVGFVDGSHVTMRGSRISDTQNGFFVARSSGAVLRDNVFEPALLDTDQTCAPICIFDNASATMRSNTISGNTNNPRIGGALIVFRDASLRSLGGNRIRNRGSQPAIGVYFDSSFRQDNVSGDGVDSVRGGINTHADSFYQLASARISGNVSVDLGSVFRYGGDVVGLTRSQVRGSIRISRDSAFVTDSRGLHVTGDIVCADEESSFSGPVDGPAGIACSEF